MEEKDNLEMPPPTLKVPDDVPSSTSVESPSTVLSDISVEEPPVQAAHDSEPTSTTQSTNDITDLSVEALRLYLSEKMGFSNYTALKSVRPKVRTTC